MLRGLYIAGVGMNERAENLDILSNNIANLQTNTFKRDRVAYTPFKDTLMRMVTDNEDSKPIGSMPYGSEMKNQNFIDFSQGPLTQSGDDNDLALEGKGFFKVMLPDGNVRYTRDGRFTITEDGSMVDVHGRSILDENNEKISIAEQGKLRVSPNGEIFQNGIQSGKIGIFEIDDLSLLAKDGDVTFRLDADAGVHESAAGATGVMQGYVERANCSPIGLMTEMISLLREYEASQKAVQVIDESIDQELQKIGTVK